MTPQEVNRLLAWAASYDARLTPRSQDDLILKAQAWSQALDPSMPFKWAGEAVTAHYAASTSSLMPADLNAAFRAERKRQADAQATTVALQAIEESRAQAVPMPDEIRQRIKALAAKTVIPE